ncbi:MAG: DUF5662 family protein [Clostridia bacterium]|nr:DUF5662 family protein [Clostridia bacterium]
MKSIELHIPALSKPENQPKWLRHLNTVNHHRMLVCQHCFKVGLYRQGLMHDLSKYHPVEFITGARYFQGFRSPNTAERLEKGYSTAWLHHKGRNKHHLEYWIDYSLDEDSPLAGMKMPVKYVVEMFCDRVAACKTYQKEKYTSASPLEYYEKSRSHYILHPETRALLEKMLTMLAEKGEEETFAYIRHEILNK